MCGDRRMSGRDRRRSKGRLTRRRTDGGGRTGLPSTAAARPKGQSQEPELERRFYPVSPPFTMLQALGEYRCSCMRVMYVANGLG